MSTWFPDKSALKRPAFKSIAEQIESAIEQGILEPGARLPPQRDLAAELQVSLQTISRAYEELRRRNLVQGEIGRGTYVKTRNLLRKMPFGSVRMAENIAELSIFKPIVDELHESLIRDALTSLGADTPNDIFSSFRPNEGLERHRQSGVDWLRLCGLTADPQRIVITNGVTQGTTTALLTAAKAGETVLAEAVSHHSLAALCSYLGMHLQGLDIDEHGIVPDAFEQACRAGGVRVLYLLPTLANPTVYMMPGQRRRDIVEIARKYQVFIIENDVLGPLVTNKPPPLAELAPERSFYLTSFTKCLMPGLRTGYLVIPPGVVRETRNRQLATTWMATSLPAEIVSRWIIDGTARKLVLWQRRAIMERYRTTHSLLGEWPFRSHPNALHIWLPLTGRWRSAPFVDQALEQGVAIAPAEPFLINFESDVRAVRVSLGSSGIDDLKRGLRVVKQLLDQEREFTLTPF